MREVSATHPQASVQQARLLAYFLAGRRRAQFGVRSRSRGTQHAPGSTEHHLGAWRGACDLARLLIRRFLNGVRACTDRSVTRGGSLRVVHASPGSCEVVRSGGSQPGSQPLRD